MDDMNKLMEQVESMLQRDNVSAGIKYEYEAKLQKQKDDAADRRSAKECENRKEVALINQETAKIESSGKIKAAVIAGVCTIAGGCLTLYGKYHFSKKMNDNAERQEREGYSSSNIDKHSKWRF